MLDVGRLNHRSKTFILNSLSKSRFLSARSAIYSTKSSSSSEDAVEFSFRSSTGSFSAEYYAPWRLSCSFVTADSNIGSATISALNFELSYIDGYVDIGVSNTFIASIIVIFPFVALYLRIVGHKVYKKVHQFPCIPFWTIT